MIVVSFLQGDPDPATWHYIGTQEIEIVVPEGGVPEFGLSLSAITSIAIVLYISIRRRLNKKE